MKPLGHTVGFAKAPHPDYLITPGIQSLSKSSHGLKGRVFELIEIGQVSPDEALALFFCPAFNEQEPAEFLFKLPDRCQGRLLSEIALEVETLMGLKILFVAAHERKKAAIFAT